MANPKQPLPDKKFKQIYVFTNSGATNHWRTLKLIDELNTILPAATLHKLEMGPRNRTETKELIEKTAKEFDEQTLVGIGGGDGTASVVIESLLLSDKLSSANRSAALLPLWGGNANDLACMLNGLIGATSLRRVMERAGIVKVYPLKLRFTPKDSPSFTRLATCYASFGATAQATWLMESSSHIRNKKTWFSSPPGRLVAEFFDISRAFARVDPFRITRGDGRRETLYERIMVNGPRFAKIESLPVKLTDRNYYQASINKKHLFMLLYLAKALLGKRSGSVTDAKQDFTINDNTWTQLDGEVLELHSGTQVELSISNKPFLAISKRINAHNNSKPATGLRQRPFNRLIRKPFGTLKTGWAVQFEYAEYLKKLLDSKVSRL